MPISEFYSDTKALTGNAEWSLSTQASGPVANTMNGVFQFFVDLSGMAAGQSVQLKVYEKVRSANSQYAIMTNTFTGAQPEPWVSPSLVLMNGWDLTANAIYGSTSPTIHWSIRRLN